MADRGASAEARTRDPDAVDKALLALVAEASYHELPSALAALERLADRGALPMPKLESLAWRLHDELTGWRKLAMDYDPQDARLPAALAANARLRLRVLDFIDRLRAPVSLEAVRARLGSERSPASRKLAAVLRDANSGG